MQNDSFNSQTSDLCAGLHGDGATDNTEAFARILDDLQAKGGGTVQLPDGVFGLLQPLHLPWNVSLVMTPGATLLALPNFQGEAVVIKDATPERNQPVCYGYLRGGTIDGGKLPIAGIQVPYACRLHIGDLEVRNACLKGLDIGADGWYEINISNVRCYLEPDVPHVPGSIGVHYQRSTDCLVNLLVIIGYETGLRSDSSSNDFHQVHVWNFPGNGPLKYCFYCNGWNDSYNQCYADSPMNGDELGYGYYVEKPFNRITNGRIYCNNWAVEDRVIGIHLAPTGTHGTYVGNHFTAREGHNMKLAFDGTLEGASFFGNSYGVTVPEGRL
ncbi:MAG: hypothetical protein ACYDBB_22670 [Armatimonadota bacterium]